MTVSPTARFWGTQILITWIGLKMILTPRLPGVPRPMSVSQLTVICVNMHDIVWASRYLVRATLPFLVLALPLCQGCCRCFAVLQIDRQPIVHAANMDCAPKRWA